MFKKITPVLLICYTNTSLIMFENTIITYVIYSTYNSHKRSNFNDLKVKKYLYNFTKSETSKVIRFTLKKLQVCQKKLK